MARLAVVLVTNCLLLAVASGAGAGEFTSPYGNENATGDSTQQKAGAFSPMPQAEAARPAAAAGQPSALAEDPRLDRGSYRIGPLDVVQISVYGVPDLSVSAKVGDDGNLQLPLLGPTPAAGKTAEELQQDLTARLAADYLQNPQVNVVVAEFNSRFVIMTGAIKNGVYPLKGETTLLQLVASVGGFNAESDSTVLILRKKGGKRYAAKYDVSAIEKGRQQDVVLQSGDRIIAGESMIKKAYGGALTAMGLAGRFSILPF